MKIIGILKANSEADFIDNFRTILSSPNGKSIGSVYYIWRTTKLIYRIKGKSNTLYIGSTKRSLFKRHIPYVGKKKARLNWNNFRYIYRKYGPITIRSYKCGNPRESEKTKLMEYFKKHFEFPPLNCTQ